MDRTRKILIGILMAVSAVCVCLIGLYCWQKRQNENVYEEMQKQVKNSKEQETQEQTMKPEKPGVEIPVDFAALQAQNPDIYAWIQIEGTNVDYPVVQSAEDDGYYLMHTVDRQEGYPGSIYTESCNRKDFTDYNTLIYGHDMLDGSMFQNLHNYSDAAYMKEHQKLIIYTAEKKLTYRIFAAVPFDDRHIMYSFDFTDRNSRQAYLDAVKGVRDMTGVVDEDVAVTADDRLVTLSTCIAEQPEKRFLVGAVLQNEEKKKAE